MIDLFGTERHKIHRTDAPDTSVAAAHAVDTKGDELRVFNHIMAAPGGLTSKELVGLMGKPINTFSGRLSALLEKNLIKDSGRRRDKCRVVVVV